MILKKIGMGTLQIDFFNVGTTTHFHLEFRQFSLA
ncbi:hypothetical protein LIBAT_05170 [Leptospira interrogans]